MIKRMLYLKFAINELIACLLLGHQLPGDETVKLKCISGLVQIGLLWFVKALGGIKGYSWKILN